MIFKKINFKLMSITLLFFCTTLVKCKHVEKRSIMQELVSNFMQMIDPKSNQKQNMPYKIIKSETVDGKVQKYFYTVPNVDSEKMKDLNNAIKLVSIQSMLNRHYKNEYRKHKMMKEIEHLSKGNENHPELKKLNEHTVKKYKYIDNYNNHRFNKEMLRLQKQAQKLIDNSPELFKNVQDHHFFVQNPQENLNRNPEFYTNSHGPEQSMISHLKHEHSASPQKAPQVFLLNPNEIQPQSLKYSRDPNKFTSHNHLKYFSQGKPYYPPDSLQYLSPPLSNEAFTKFQESILNGQGQSGGQRTNTKELFYSKPYLGPKENPWVIKQKSPTIGLPSQQEIPWSVVPLPPPLPTLHMGASDSEYSWAVGGLPQSHSDNTFNKAESSDMNTYWALRPLPPPMQIPRDMQMASSSTKHDCKSNEDITLESTSDPLVINTYMRHSALKTEENYDDLHIPQESTIKTYTVDAKYKNDSRRKEMEDGQQESTMQQYSINPILAQQYQRYNNQQKSLVKTNNNTQNASENSKQKDNNRASKKQEQTQSPTNHKEVNITSTATTFTRKYQPRNQNQNKQLVNPEQSQNFNVNQEKVIQQRQQQLKQFYEKQKQQRQLIRNNNKNLLPETKNLQDNGRSYMFNSKLNTQHVAAIPVDIAIPIEESDWIPIQPKYKMSHMNGNMHYEQMPASHTKDIDKPPMSNIDVMLVFSNETKIKSLEEPVKLEKHNIVTEKAPVEKNTTDNEIRRHISNDQIQNVDETIRKLTFSKPIYEVPIVNNHNSINSEKTVVIEVLNSDKLETNKKKQAEDDIEGSESNTVPVKVKYETRTKGQTNKEKHSQNDEHVISPVRTYERVKVKGKHKKHETVPSENQTSILNITTESKTNLENNATKDELLQQTNSKPTEKPIVDDKTIEKWQEIDESTDHNNNPDVIKQNNNTALNDTVLKNLEKDSKVVAASLTEEKYVQIEGNSNLVLEMDNRNRTTPANTTNVSKSNDNKVDHSVEYVSSGSNIKELIANRSKIIRPFFRNKQILNITSTTTTTTTTTTSTTSKPIVVKPARIRAPETIRDQKIEESKTHVSYDDYDDQLSFENIRAAQEFNFPKTDISYSVNLPKSSTSVFKSVENERLINPNRKHSNKNQYRDRNSNRKSPTQRQRDQNDYENREVQTYVTPTYDTKSRYSVYENTNPFEGGGGPSFYNDEDSHHNDHVDLKNIRIPSPDEIDLESIDIPNPDTIKVKGVGHTDEDFGNHGQREENEGTGDEEEESESEKENNEGDAEEDTGDDADNEESKTSKKVDTSFKHNNQRQNVIDSENSNTQKHFDISNIPIPEYNEDHMNQIKEKYNIPSPNIENIPSPNQNNNENQEQNSDPVIQVPKDYLVRNQFNDEIPNYNVPLDASQEKQNDDYNNDANTSNNNEDEAENDDRPASQNSFETAESPFNQNLNSYTLNNENHNFPFRDGNENFRMRNLMKKPIPDHFDQDKQFGYGKFSEEEKEDPRSDDFEEKKDPRIQSNRFISQSENHATLRNMPSNYAGKVIESHVVKQIPIAFKTVIKPVNYETSFKPISQRFRSLSGIQQPFRPSPQLLPQSEARFAGHQTKQTNQQPYQDNRQLQPSQYFGHNKEHNNYGTQNSGSLIQTDIIPAQEFDLQQFEENFRDFQNQFRAPDPSYSQAGYNSPQTHSQYSQKDFTNHFNPTAKIGSQLGSSVPAIESPNISPSQDTLSNLRKVKSFSNMNINRVSPSSQPIVVPPLNNGNINIGGQQSPITQQGNSPSNSHFRYNTNGNYYFPNQLETPIATKTPNTLSNDIKQGLIVYHPTKHQMKSVSHVLITPPTVEKQQQQNPQPQIQEKNFQHSTNADPNIQQKYTKPPVRVIQHANLKPSGSQRPEITRLRHVNNNYSNPPNTNNNHQTNILQQINKQNRGLPHEQTRARYPTGQRNSNNFRNIPVRDQNTNGNFRQQLPAPKPTFTLQQIQSIKSNNLPPHVREYNELRKPRYELSHDKNVHTLQTPSGQFNQNFESNDYIQNNPIEHNEQYFNQEPPAQRPFIYNNKNFKSNYRPQNFGNYNFDTSVTAVQSTIEEHDSEEDNNNSEETEGKEGRDRPNDPTHHDTDSKEHYLNNGNQHFLEQKYQYQIPNNNEFVQNIRLPQKIPKIEKLRVTNEFTNVNVNQYNKYHPDNLEPHFLPTPTPEPQISSTPKYKGKARTLVFSPSQRDPFSNNIQLSTPSYSLPEPTVTPHGLQSSTFSPAHFTHTLQSSTAAPPSFAHNIQSSTLAPPHYSTTPSSLSEHPLPLLSPQQFLAPTTPLTPHYSTPRPEEQSQFIPPEREQFLQIQTPLPTTYGQYQPHIHNHGQPQLASYEEQRPQFYINQQNPFEIPQEHQNLNNGQVHQTLVENFGPTQGYIQHQIPRPHHQGVHQLPLGFSPNPELQNFDLHNPQANQIHLHQPQLNYSPNEHYHIPENPFLEEQQYIPLQNLNSPGRMIHHTFYPHKKADEDLSQEQDVRNDEESREYQSSYENRNSNERNINLMSNEENFDPYTESLNARTDSKLQFDYVDSKTRIQPHGVKVIGENLKFEESRHADQQNQEIDDKNNPSASSSNIKKDKTFQKTKDADIGIPVDDFVQKYVDYYNNQQETKQNGQISDPDFVIQKSLGTEYQLFSKEDENKEEENRFVPQNFVTPSPVVNYVTPIPNNEDSTSNIQSSKNENENFQSFQLINRHPQTDTPSKNIANLIDLNTRETNFHNGLQSPQVQHNHFTQHVSSANNLQFQKLKGNKIPISTQNNPFQQPSSNSPFQQPSSNSPFQQTSSNSPFQQLSSNNPLQQSSSNSPFQQPSSNNPFQQPSSNNPFQQPSSNNPFHQQPSSNNPFQQPSSNNPFHQLSSNNPLQQSSSNGPFQKPSSNNPFQQPFSNSPFHQQPSNNSPFHQQPSSNNPFHQPSSNSPFNQPSNNNPFHQPSSINHFHQSSSNNPFKQQNIVKSQSFTSAHINKEGNFPKSNDLNILEHSPLNINHAQFPINTNQAQIPVKNDQLFPNNNNQAQFFENRLKFNHNRPSVDNSNINPSHYLIKDSDMPTVLLNTGGAKNENSDKPNVKTYIQFAQPDGKFHQVVPGVVKSEPKVIKPQEVPLVLNPFHLSTQTQIVNPAQNEKIKIIIPTITEQQTPVHNVHYKLPKSEVVINRFHEHTIKSSTKPTDASLMQLQHNNVQPSQNNQHQPTGFKIEPPPLQGNNQIYESSSIGSGQLNNNNQQSYISPTHQPISLEQIKQNIQLLQGKIHNLQGQNNIFQNKEPYIVHNEHGYAGTNSPSKPPSPTPSSQQIPQGFNQQILQNLHRQLQNTPHQSNQQEFNIQNNPNLQKIIQNLQSQGASLGFTNQNNQNFAKENILKSPIINKGTSQPIGNIPSNHQHYDIFGEYGQKKQIKEPYRFEPPNVKQNVQSPLISTNQLNNIYHANNRQNFQNTQVFRPLVLDFNNPNSNNYYFQNRYNGNNFNRPVASEPVRLPNSLVSGVESESIGSTQKLKHPSIIDLTSDQSEQSTNRINITGTNLVNPWFQNKTKLNREKLDRDKDALTPILHYLTVANNANESFGKNSFDSKTETKSNEFFDENVSHNTGSGDITDDAENSSASHTKTFHFENNENNIPILSSANSKLPNTDRQNEENVNFERISKKYNLNFKKHSEEKTKIELGSKQSPEDNYDSLHNLDDNMGTFSNQFEMIQLVPLQLALDEKENLTGVKNQTTDNKYRDAISKSYEIIRQSMKEEDDKDKIDISGLYNTPEKSTNRSSKQLFNNYINITRSKSEHVEKDHQTQQQPRQSVYGKTIDINYFNRRKNGLNSNEDAFDDVRNRIQTEKSNSNSNYSTRIINLLKNNTFTMFNNDDNNVRKK